MRAYTIVAAVVMVISGSAAAAAPTGVQWTPDGLQILVNKDVNDERWSITWNLADVSATGNVFFADDRVPAFIWCEKRDSAFAAGELTLQYRCSGSDAASGGFNFADWTVISDSVFLPVSFFIPPADTCDLTSVLNGTDAGHATSIWDCNGNEGTFQFQAFANGTAVSSATTSFNYDVVAGACAITQLDDGSFIDVEYRPSQDHLTIYEIPAAVDHVILSECVRGT